MFNDTRFGVEVFWMHIRGVDTIFVLSYLHILKKIYIKNYLSSDSDGWLIGGYAFFLTSYYSLLRYFSKRDSSKWSNSNNWSEYLLIRPELHL
jgi:quinol-cytochrome oxidoreductase complex cytochrome b subunit